MSVEITKTYRYADIHTRFIRIIGDISWPVFSIKYYDIFGRIFEKFSEKKFSESSFHWTAYL